MYQKNDLQKSISKFLPKIKNYFKDKGINPTKEDYIRILKKNIGNDIDEKDIVGGMDEFIGKDGDFIHGDMNFNKREIFVGINNPETSSEFSQDTSQGPRYYWGSQYGRSGRTLGESKMKKMIEDYVGKKSSGNGVIPKTNEIPDLTKLKYDFNKPIISRKTKTLGEMIEREGASGEEIAIILNHLLSISGLNIPSHYKKILTDKINNG